MSDIARHIELLLQRYECVVLPGWGAFLCNYNAAHFTDQEQLRLDPPARFLAFNELLATSDGLLADSIARAEGTTFEKAQAEIASTLAQMRKQLEMAGELEFGRLGTFTLSLDRTLIFLPKKRSTANGPLYGLRPLILHPIEQIASTTAATPDTSAATEEPAAQRRISIFPWRAAAACAAAVAAVAVTAVLFLTKPIQVDRPVDTASIAPVEAPSTISDPLVEQEPLPAAKISEVPEISVVPESAEISPIGKQASLPAAESSEASDISKKSEVSEKSASPIRFNPSDRFVVIIASFPTRSQAETYLASNSSRQLGILEKDDRYRIYSATAPNRSEAENQKLLTGQSDAWIALR